MPDAALRIERVSKSFGDVRALRDVSLSFFAGEVHAVLGENGAGKSTLMSVLAGFVVPDSGTAKLAPAHGDHRPLELSFGRPHEARARGIEMVHQHFMLVPEFTVAENFALGTLASSVGLLDMRSVERRVREVAHELGWEIDVGAKVRSLPVGSRQRLEVIKALAGDARVLILDEPTAVLSPSEVLDLFRVLRRLRDDGRCVILIAHKLSEVMSVADRVSVLRRGELVASALIGEVDEATLAQWMVGEVPVPRSPLSSSDKPPLLRASGVHIVGDRGQVSVRGASFEVRRGEVLGIGGVDGNGQIELAEALVGLRRLDSGRLAWSESGHRTGYVPQDRHGEGLALSMSVLDNVLIEGQSHGELWSGPFLRMRRLVAEAERMVRDFDVRVGSLDDPVRSLSGGNQQKLVVSRVLSSSPDLLVAHNPTRGLDVRATAYVQERIIEAARNGAAVVLFSTDLDELAALSTRTMFMKRGELHEGGAEAMVG